METIATDALRLTVAPACGGGIVRLVADPRGAAADVLRPADPARVALGDPTGLACVAAVPYVGPVSGGRLRFGGRSHRLVAGHPGLGAPRNGEGWLAPWRVDDRTERSLSLVHEHDPERSGGSFPFAYRAFLGYVLDGATLVASLSVASLADGPMPAGLGFEPRFPLAKDTTLRFDATGVWCADPIAERHPLGALPADWSFAEARRPGHAVIDRSFEGWDGAAELVWPARSLHVALTARPPLVRLRLRTPDGAGALMLGPSTQAPDGINLMAAAIPEHGIAVLEPGEAVSAEMRLAVRIR